MNDRVRLMIADDHRPYRDGLSRAIRRHGQLELIGEAADGAQAVQLARELNPDLVLADVRMPVVDGLEVARQLGEPEVDIPVVLITGDPEGLHEPAREAGARALLSKELSRDEICRRLLALL